MFSSLHKVDFGIEDERGRVAVQTDHRTADEIEATFDLSIVFGLARAINPIRSGQFAVVQFAQLAPTPDRYLAVLRAAGAEIEAVGSDEILRGDPDDARAHAAAADALTAVGTRALTSRGLAIDPEGLRALEREYAGIAAVGVEGDEIVFHTALVELGAATGEVLRRIHGGEWAPDPEFFSLIPFVFERDGMLTNVFGKVERFFAEGDSEAPTRLLMAAQDHGLEDGPVMFNLRPRGWGARDLALWIPLAPHLDALEDADIPVVALVHDLPNTVKTISHETPDQEIPDLLAQARRSLADVEVQITEIEAGDHTVLVVHGNYYAAEKILDPAFVMGIHARLGSELLAAAMPIKGQLHLMTAETSPDWIAVFGTMAMKHHGEAPANERLSTEVFLLSEGRVVGIAQQVLDASPADPKGNRNPQR